MPPPRHRPSSFMKNLRLFACVGLCLLTVSCADHPSERVDQMVADAHNELAAGRDKVAVDRYTAVLSLASNNAEALRGRGAALHNLGMTAAALDDLNIAVTLAPDDAVAFQNRAVAFVSQHRYADAIRDFDRALDLGRDFAGLRCDLALAHSQNGNLEQAIHHYGAAIRLDPNEFFSTSIVAPVGLITENSMGQSTTSLQLSS